MVIVGFATLDISMPKGHYILLKNISVIGAPLDIVLRNQPEDIHHGMSRMIEWLGAGALRPKSPRPIRSTTFSPRSPASRTAPLQGAWW